MNKKKEKNQINTNNLVKQGISFVKKGRFAEAIESYNAAIDILPTSELFVNKGLSLLALKKESEAVKTFYMATELRLTPDNLFLLDHAIEQWLKSDEDCFEFDLEDFSDLPDDEISDHDDWEMDPELEGPDTRNYERILARVIDKKISETIVTSLKIENKVKNIQHYLQFAIQKNMKNESSYVMLIPLLDYFRLLAGYFPKDYSLDTEYEVALTEFRELNDSGYYSYMEYLMSDETKLLNYFDFICNLDYHWFYKFILDIIPSKFKHFIQSQVAWVTLENEMRGIVIQESINELPNIINSFQISQFKLNKVEFQYKDLVIVILGTIVFILQKIYNRRVEEHYSYITQIQVTERNRIISNLSHSIKNMISSAIIDPLALMKPSSSIDTVRIKEALKGADLIRQMVDAMNQSSMGTLEDFIYDAKHSTVESESLRDLIFQSLVYSVGNMFHGKYFSEFQRAYFPERDSYLQAYNQWEAIIQSNDMEYLKSYLKEYFFDFEVQLTGIDDYVIGNTKGSSIKLMILLQEILLNAVKYSAFVERSKRHISIKLMATEESIELSVSNSYKPRNQVKTTGLGLEIIRNFAKLLDTKPEITSENGVYTLELKFINIWRANENPIR